MRHPKGKHCLPLAFKCMGRDWRMKIRLLFSIFEMVRCVISLGTTNQVCWEYTYCGIQAGLSGLLTTAIPRQKPQRAA